MKLKEGDRVKGIYKNDDDDDETVYFGIVTYISDAGGRADILRDDGKEGSGNNSTWKVMKTKSGWGANCTDGILTLENFNWESFL